MGSSNLCWPQLMPCELFRMLLPTGAFDTAQVGGFQGTRSGDKQGFILAMQLVLIF